MGTTVSVITACFNSESTIEETIRSVAEQDYRNIEHIVVDGGSSDRTLGIIEKSARSSLRCVFEPAAGIYGALNRGIRESSGDIIAILHSDDFYSGPSVIRQVVDAMNDAGSESLYGDLLYVRRDAPSQVVRRWIAGNYRAGAFRRGWMPPHPTFFVRRSSYADHGLYDTSFRSSGDYELMLRFLHRFSISVTYLPQILVHMRTGGISNRSLRNRLRAAAEDRRAWRMNGLMPGMFTLILKPLSKLPQFLLR
jgi:glycosyltransferase involved in cell wall biosynthesis